MADEIEDLGPIPARPTTAGLQAARPSGGQASSRPSNQPNLDRRDGGSTSTSKTGVVQPQPQALAKRSGPSSIIVSPRQKGNPILNNIKSMPWEYGDIPADYVLGLTTCALFLSLKYHRLHPEYIYSRIKGLQGKYALRIILCLVDIDNHEQSLKELSKTSIINNVTVMLCWSAAEGGRYLELFKTYENAAPTSIKQHQSTAYEDRVVDFFTTPRSINKTDASSLLFAFGSVRTAVNARYEDISVIPGFGERKVQQWCTTVREPFRVQRAAKRGLDAELFVGSQPVSRAPTLSREVTRAESDSPAPALNRTVSDLARRPATGGSDADRRPISRLAEKISIDDEFADDEQALTEAMTAKAIPPKQKAPAPASTAASATVVSNKRKQNDDPLNDGVMAALSKLRKA